MRRIGAVNTTPELVLRSCLWGRGLRYRINYRLLNVRPDIVFIGAKTVIFVDGCFWHGCPDHYAAPRNRIEFWSKKLHDNVLRDARQTRELIGGGWHVLRFLAHDVLEHLDDVANIVESCVRRGSCLGGETWRVLKAEETAGGREHQELLCLQSLTRQVRDTSRARNSVRRYLTRQPPRSRRGPPQSA